MDKKLFDFVYGCAMGDATMRLAYPHIGKGSSPSKRKLALEYPCAKKSVQEFVDSILNNMYKSQEEYDKAFETCAKQVEKVLPCLTFGNIQKLINITLKHIYLVSYHNPDILPCFQYCHCPVDGQMLKKIWESRFETDTQPPKPYAWSKEDFSDTSKYSSFQIAAREYAAKHPEFGTNLIELDYSLWNT